MVAALRAPERGSTRSAEGCSRPGGFGLPNAGGRCASAGGTADSCFIVSIHPPPASRTRRTPLRMQAAASRRTPGLRRCPECGSLLPPGGDSACRMRGGDACWRRKAARPCLRSVVRRYSRNRCFSLALGTERKWESRCTNSASCNVAEAAINESIIGRRAVAACRSSIAIRLVFQSTGSTRSNNGKCAFHSASNAFSAPSALSRVQNSPVVSTETPITVEPSTSNSSTSPPPGSPKKVSPEPPPVRRAGRSGRCVRSVLSSLGCRG